MVKYFFKRFFRGCISVVIAICLIMMMVFSWLDDTLIFAEDEQYVKLSNNQKTTYMYQKWEEYGYLDYLPYTDWLNEKADAGEITEEERQAVATVGRTAEEDSEIVSAYVQEFTKECEAQGYTVVRLDAVMATPTRIASGGSQSLFAYQNTPLLIRLFNFFTGILEFDNINYVEEDIGERGLTFTLFDPAYGGETFSPAIMGNGTLHKYLLYFDNTFPYIHQNFLTIKLGTSYSVNKGVDAFETMIQPQGNYVKSTTYYPTGVVEESADNLHTATYLAGSRDLNLVYADLYTDDYTNVSLVKDSGSRISYSFVVSIIASALAYCIGLPLGILMAKKKDTWVDRLGNAYIVVLMAVPGLAYMLMLKAIGTKLGLPTTFSLDNPTAAMYIMPIISSTLGAIAGEMKWMRRYMVDQMNSDYVKFARAEGLSEREIFTKHIFKNAAIPIAHGVPGVITGALSGAIIMEQVYTIPGVGGLLVQAIGAYDNAVIVGVALFYGILFIISTILGDILMAVMDPRISYTSKAR